jgi:8-oxo-dGTP pyrophosphatase MutT (NUDIX family)
MSNDLGGWRRVNSETGPDYKVFKVRVDTMVSPRTGREGRYVILDAPNWVNIIALTGEAADPEAQIVLVRQYRHGVDTVALEIPSGQIDRDEEPLAAARRELAEETGYTGERWTELGRERPNAAWLSNWCYNFLVEGARLTAEPQLDEGEAITVELRKLSEIPGLIRRGDINQALIINAFYWLRDRSSD